MTESRSPALLLCILLSLSVRGVAAQTNSRWTLVDSSTESTLLVDRASVRILGNHTREVWFRNVLRRPQSDTSYDGKRYQFIAEAWLYRMDCGDRRLGHQARIRYALSGKAVQTVDFTDPAFAAAHVADMRAVAPETGAELLLRAGCALTSK
jgi:hypothetical protein